MESNGIVRQEAESFVFDEENCEGKNSKIKRRNKWCYYLYYIIIPSVVTVITFVLMVVIDRKLIPLWSHPLINSSSTETASFQLSKTEALKAEEETKRETRASAHLFYNLNEPNTTSGANPCLMWDISTSGSFVSEGIIFQSDTNSLQVKKSGIYQVYSKLTLKNNGINSTGEQSYSALLKNGEQLTMEPFRLPLPGEDNMHHVLHFGIYPLDADDKLCVTMPKDSVSYILKRARASFFGLNLIGPI